MKSSDVKELERLRERERKEKARRKKVNETFNARYDRITITVDKGEKQRIQAAANVAGYDSMNSYIVSLIIDDMKMRGLETTATTATIDKTE